jgi:hypothetical protein
MSYEAFKLFSMEKMDEFFKKHDVEKFRIKDWHQERGEKLHSLMKDGPGVNIGLILKDVLEPFMPRINEIIENKNNQYEEVINFKTENNEIISKSFILNKIDNELFKLIGKAVADRLGEGLLPPDEIEIGINKVGFDHLGVGGLGPTNWHTDAGGSGNFISLITYLVDVNDKDDGAFEMCNEPEKNFYDNDTLGVLSIHVGEELQKRKLVPKEGEIGTYITGPKYTTLMFVPYFAHKANYPKRKDRIVLAMTLHLSPSKNFVDLKKYNLE